MKCPRCGAPLVVDPLESFCELETCPEVGAAMVMCSRHYLLGGDWQTGCAFEGCPAILPRLAAERARLLGVLNQRAEAYMVELVGENRIAEIFGQVNLLVLPRRRR